MNSEKINILLVEDDKDDYFLFETYAGKLTIPCNLEWASSYEEGLSCIKKKSNYDLCFVDYHLGEKNGIDFIKETKKLNLPQGIIMLTGQGDDALGIQAMRVGADDYYNKSGLNTQTLNRAIQFTIERRKARLQEEALIRAKTEKRFVEKQKENLATLLEELKISQERLKLAQKAGSIGTYEWIIKEKKILWTPELEALYGFAPGEFDGSHETWVKRIHPEDVNRVVELLDTALKGGTPFNVEFRTVWDDGSEHWLLAKGDVYINQDGTPERVVGINIDISTRKALERQKDDFLGIASHELKTPVTSIKAFTQVLANRFAKKGDEQSTVLLQKMDTQINKLTVLINDLLDVTKIEGGKLQLNQDYFYFDELVDEIVEEVQRTTQKHTIYKEGLVKKTIYGDRDRIGQVITNFLTNAIKYSPDSKKIIIKSYIEKQQIALSVQDFGVGIPDDNIPYLFQRFYRVNAETHETVPGIGLGLYISSEIIKRQGGTLWVESKESKGSLFGFKLPLKSKN